MPCRLQMGRRNDRYQILRIYILNWVNQLDRFQIHSISDFNLVCLVRKKDAEKLYSYLSATIGSSIAARNAG